MSEEVKRFSLKRREIPLEIENVEGVPEKYVLREFDGTVRDLHMAKMQAKMGKNPDGTPTGLKTFTGVFSGLLSLSLFKEDNAGNFTLAVKEEEIQTWPASVQREIHKMAQELQGISKTAEQEAKND